MATLLLELFSEEIPSRMQRAAAEQLQRLITDGFKKHSLAPTGCKTFVSPRHLAIQCSGLPTIQPDVREEKRGPKIGAPEQALKGFLAASGLTLAQCEQRDGYYYTTIERKGQPTSEVVKKIIEDTLSVFSWPKSMRWGDRPLAWVRPLHRLACLLDSAIVPVQFAHLSASNVTEGHRFLRPGTITIPHAEQYETLLAKAHVIVDYAARREKISAGITAKAAAANLAVVADEALLDEVTGLVEWPVPLLGSFDQKFLDLPPEVLISEMKVHQRYFALNDANGKLTNQFIAVANMETADGGKAVIAGNERVLRARLSDGEFYWQQDRKTSLEDWGKKLSDVVFHAKVGMMNEKVQRIETLALAIAKEVGFTDTASVARAAQLCKADLTSGMVGEFPDLQGIMGRYYATAQGESADVADAIRDHYKPVGANDSVPESKLAAIIAVADKLDSIVALFAVGEKPTGSRDPLALRRAALGYANIDFHHELGVPLVEILQLASELVHEDIYNHVSRNKKLSSDSKNSLEYFKDKKAVESAEYIIDVMTFVIDRAKTLISNVRHDVINSIDEDNEKYTIIGFAERARSLQEWVATISGKDAIAAIKRSLNILAAEEKKSKTTFAADSASNLAQPAEKQLAAALAKPFTTPADLESLTAPINQFFTDLLVTEPEFREARLGLLAQVRAATLNIADFSKIEG